MRILYFDWNEFTGRDCREAMERQGHVLGVWRHLWNCLAVDEEFSERTERALFSKDGAGPTGRDCDRPREGAPQWDLVFSFNFYPQISEVCERFQVPYVSWTFDSPYLPLTSRENRNAVNRILHFDGAMVRILNKMGAHGVRHLPLPVNGRRLRRLRETSACSSYRHGISFVGGLYANENNRYNKVAHLLSPFLRSYVEDVLALQTGVYGRDLIGDAGLVPDSVVDEIQQSIRFEVSESYGFDRGELVRDMLRTQATEMDRFSILEALGRAHPGEVDLYTRWDSPELMGVRNMGYAQYYDEMPMVFCTSKINLNITLRTIRTGIPLRALDVMAAGGFLLSTYGEELADKFVQGRDLVYARDPEELMALADFFLEREEEREAIAANGCERVCELFDYDRLLEEALKL